MVGKHIDCTCQPYTQLQPLGLDLTKQVWEIKGVKTGYNKTCLVSRNLEIWTVLLIVKTVVLPYQKHSPIKCCPIKCSLYPHSRKTGGTVRYRSHILVALTALTCADAYTLTMYKYVCISR